MKILWVLEGKGEQLLTEALELDRAHISARQLLTYSDATECRLPGLFPLFIIPKNTKKSMEIIKTSLALTCRSSEDN